MSTGPPVFDLPRHRASDPLRRLLRFVWTLPTNLLGHVAGCVVSGSTGRYVGSPFATARVYVIRAPGLGWVGGVTLGHAILLSPTLTTGLRGRLVLAHELAHTRQHDMLGPAYLPLHILAQGYSALHWRVRRVPGSDPVHAHNPLEERFLFLPHRHLRALCGPCSLETRERLEAQLDALGV